MYIYIYICVCVCVCECVCVCVCVCIKTKIKNIYDSQRIDNFFAIRKFPNINMRLRKQVYMSAKNAFFVEAFIVLY